MTLMDLLIMFTCYQRHHFQERQPQGPNKDYYQSYFKDRWNMFDFITVLGSIVDALMVEFAVGAFLL